MNFRSSRAIGIYASIGILLVITVYMALNVHHIDEHHLGIVIDDGVVEKAIGPGIHWSLKPLTHIVSSPTTPVSEKTSDLSMATKDNFAMNDSVIEYTFLIPEEKALDLYRENPQYVSDLKATVGQVAKNTIGQFELIDVPRNRGKIEQIMKDKLNEYASKTYDIDHFVTNLKLAYYGWESRAKSYLTTIREEKQKIHKEKLAKKRDEVSRKNALERTKNKNKQRHLDTKAKNEREEQLVKSKAKRQKIQAQADKEAAIAKAEGEAKAERLVNAAELEKLKELIALVGKEGAVKLNQVKVWDGAMPKIIGSGDELSLKPQITLTGD